jgi:hypothetical protein
MPPKHKKRGASEPFNAEPHAPLHKAARGAHEPAASSSRGGSLTKRPQPASGEVLRTLQDNAHTLQELYQQAQQQASAEDAVLLEKVRVLGHYPRSLNAASQATASKERRDEKNLCQHLKRRRKTMHSSCHEFLAVVKAEGADGFREFAAIRSSPGMGAFEPPVDLGAHISQAIAAGSSGLAATAQVNHLNDAASEPRKLKGKHPKGGKASTNASAPGSSMCGATEPTALGVHVSQEMDQRMKLCSSKVEA